MEVTRLGLVLALALSVASCGILLDAPPPGASLQVEAAAQAESMMVGNPPRRMPVVNGPDDPKGLVGIEVEVYARNLERQKFFAKDLPSARFEVPESGTINVDLLLRQDGAAVAQGRVTWLLEPGVEWKIVVDRAPSLIYLELDNMPRTGPNPLKCGWWWCHEVWRFEIQQDALNYEGEALWLMIWRVVPGACADVCWEPS